MTLSVIFMLSVANKPFMLSVFMLNAVIQSVVMLNVVSPLKYWQRLSHRTFLSKFGHSFI
jgi:hypothetical protein